MSFLSKVFTIQWLKIWESLIDSYCEMEEGYRALVWGEWWDRAADNSAALILVRMLSIMNCCFLSYIYLRHS